jgi:hypothetical protein
MASESPAKTLSPSFCSVELSGERCEQRTHCAHGRRYVGNQALVELLLERGANPALTDTAHRTAVGLCA